MRRCSRLASFSLALITAVPACSGRSAPWRDPLSEQDAAPVDPFEGYDAEGFDAVGFDAEGSELDADTPGPGDDGGVEPGEEIPPSPPLTETRPNIVVIMADDLDQESLQTLLERGWAPKIKRHLVQAGVRFANSMAINPVCCPSRAAFLSGQYSHNNGVAHNGPPSGGVGAFHDGSTIGTWLHRAGYRTGFIGKYLNGYGGGSTRQYVPPGWDDWQGLTQGTYHMWDYHFNDNGTDVHYGTAPNEYQTDVIARRAVEFIDESHAQNPEQPFLLVVTPTAPHGEIGAPGGNGGIRPPPRYSGVVSLPLPSPPSLNEADVSDKPSYVRRMQLTQSQLDDMQRKYRERLAATRAIDDLVGSVVEALEHTGDIRNTLLVLTSDNGYLLGQHRWFGKMVPWEESIRVPLYVRVPNSTTARTVRRLVANTDLPATFVELAGATAGHVLDGRSLVPLLRGAAPGRWRARLLIEHGASGDDEDIGDQVPDYSAVRTAHNAVAQPHRLFSRYESGDRELYDLDDDPHELASRHAARGIGPALDRMNAWRVLLKRCAGIECRRAEN